MNRIILIGNGFDCAHGLYTKYNDFVDWFWERQLNFVNQTNSSEETWKKVDISIDINNVEKYRKYQQNDFFDVIFEEKDGKKLSDFDKKSQRGIDFMLDNENKDKIEQKPKFKNIEELKKNNIVYKNKFLELIDKREKIQNWVDIEELYFEVLTNCKDRYKQSESVYEIYTIHQLNKEFRDIKRELAEFIQTRNNEVAKNAEFRQKLENDIVAKVKNIISEGDVENILLLNFNYSNTAFELYNEINGKKITDNLKIISIHGTAKYEDNNPMIFGYGDEFCDDSAAIEELNDNDFLENVKSIKYIETDNYSDFLKFLDKEYDVFVFGHSCGNSDRTLLKELFENKNCTAIRCFYYKDDFSKTVDNIYRKFKDKTSFRKKMLKKGKDDAFPQFEMENSPFYKEPKKEIEISVVETQETEMPKIEPKSEKSYLEIYNMVKVEFDKESDAYKNISDAVTSKNNLKKDFYIGKYQVTQKEWKEIMGKNPSHFSEEGMGGDAVKGFDTENFPVEWVSWYDAVDFCNTLSEKYGLKKYYNRNGNDVSFNVDANGFRLPTSAESQYAARGGKETKNYQYSGSNTIDDVAWYYANSGGKNLKGEDWDYDKAFKNNNRTHRVGTKNANELKVYDMSGNVDEWCEDYNNGEYVTRGGNCYLRAAHCAVSWQSSNFPNKRYFFIGLRLACSI